LFPEKRKNRRAWRRFLRAAVGWSDIPESAFFQQAMASAGSLTSLPLRRTVHFLRLNRFARLQKKPGDSADQGIPQG